MTTDELQCIEACNEAERVCLARVSLPRVSDENATIQQSHVFTISAEICALTARVLARDADFGARELASLCSKLCRSAADLSMKAEPADATNELVEALIACADTCHIVALGTHPATS